MTNYTLRNGVFLIEIHGVYLLVADKEGRKYCKYVRRVNELGSIIIKMLAKKISIKQIHEKIKEEYDVNDNDTLTNDIVYFIESLKQNNYVLCEEEDNDIQS